MPAPAAVQRQINKANKLHAEHYAKSEEPSAADVISNLPGAEAPAPVSAEVVPPAEVITPPAEPTEPVNADGGDSSPAAPTEVAGNEDSGKGEDFEQKYKVLQGKYNAELPRLNTQVGDLEGEVTQMRSLLAGMDQSTSSVELPQGEKLLNDAEIRDYGADMIGVMKRAAREEFMPLITQLQTENKNLKDMLGGVSESVSGNAYDAMIRALNTNIPNWKEINQDTGFLEWLDGIDAFSGDRKGAMLTHAFDSNDAARVIAFFSGYLSENKLVTPAPAPVEPTTPKVDLMSMVAPGTQGAPVTPNAHMDKRVYSQADIRQFYRDVQLGKFKGKDAERSAIERDILAAGPEGRLR